MAAIASYLTYMGCGLIYCFLIHLVAGSKEDTTTDSSWNHQVDLEQRMDTYPPHQHMSSHHRKKKMDVYGWLFKDRTDDLIREQRAKMLKDIRFYFNHGTLMWPRLQSTRGNGIGHNPFFFNFLPRYPRRYPRQSIIHMKRSSNSGPINNSNNNNINIHKEEKAFPW